MKTKNLSGVYLVIDPSVEQKILLEKVEQALHGGVGILQIWNHWPAGTGKSGKKKLVENITDLAKDFKVPVLIDKDWQLLKATDLDGVHFEAVPDNFDQIQEEIGRDFIAGITCSNDLQVVRWADEHKLDYISFCAMFPSPSVSSCDIVRPETVQKAREMTDLPLFLSGGITPGKIAELAELDFNGVAVISGILSGDAPCEQALAYKKALNDN